MTRLKIAGLAAALLMTTAAAHATTIVNLNAGSVAPNAGNNSGGAAYNPITLTLAAGVYSVGVVGKAGGGIYDAYAVYAPTSSNLAYTDGNWSVSVNGIVQTQSSTQRFNTEAESLAFYKALAPLTFTLTSASTVTYYYVDDTAFPYFGDDSGGISLAINQVPVPEPISLALLGTGLAGLGLVRRRRGSAAA